MPLRPRRPPASPAALAPLAALARASARHVCLAVLAGSLGCAPARAVTPPQWHLVNAAAEQASSQCLHQMHHDTDEFSSCVDAAVQRAAGDPAAQLGAGYLGLVGCLSAQRIATLHADTCAQAYLQQVDRLRKALRLSDSQLCPTVRGDCRSRIALIEALRKKSRKPPQKAAGHAAR